MGLKMVDTKDINKLFEYVVALNLRVTATERVLQKEGVITRERYIKELESCTEEVKAMMSTVTSSEKVLS